MQKHEKPLVLTAVVALAFMAALAVLPACDRQTDVDPDVRDMNITPPPITDPTTPTPTTTPQPGVTPGTAGTTGTSDVSAPGTIATTPEEAATAPPGDLQVGEEMPEPEDVAPDTTGDI